jgi:hypothetical protein
MNTATILNVIKHESLSYIRSWNLNLDSISVHDIPLLLGYCERDCRFDFAFKLLAIVSPSASNDLEHQIDLLVLEILGEDIPPKGVDERIYQWAIDRRLIIDTNRMISEVEKAKAVGEMIGLRYFHNLWIIHPSAKLPGYWQATHYDLHRRRMTGDTSHQSLEELFHFTGACIHPHAEIESPSIWEPLIMGCQ